MTLDKLQVELCEDTPYEIPSPEETRERILKAMDHLSELERYKTELIREMNEAHERAVNLIMELNHLT